MALPSAYEFLKRLMDDRGERMVDGTIKAVNGALVDVKVAGSSRTLTGVPLAEHVYTDRLVPGAPCSLALYQTQPFVIAIHLPPSSDDPTQVGGAVITGGATIPQPSIAVTLSGSTYNITWRISNSHKYKYEVFANDDDTGTTVTQIDTTHFGVMETTYQGSLTWFACRAVDQAGQRGPMSAWVTVTGQPSGVPPAPTIEVEYLSSAVEITIEQSASGGVVPDKWAVYKATDGSGTGSTFMEYIDVDPSGTTIYLGTTTQRDTYTHYRVCGVVQNWSGDPTTYLSGAYSAWEEDDNCPAPDEDPLPYTLTAEGWLISWDYLIFGTDYEDHMEFVDVFTWYAGME